MATLAGKIVVVVGGTSGIGLGVARGSLFSQAAHVVVASSKQVNVDNATAALNKLITEKALPGKVSGQALNAHDVDAVKKFTESLGEIDHLVWTAGDSPASLTEEGIMKFAESSMNIRYWSPIASAKAAKIRPGGSIIFTTGTAAFKPRRGFGVAAGLGGAVDALTRGLAVDLAPVRVNVVSPGLVDTNLWKDLSQEYKDAIIKEASQKMLVKHVADGDEVAEAYLFLMKCNYVTGQTIHVEGGYLLC